LTEQDFYLEAIHLTVERLGVSPKRQIFPNPNNKVKLLKFQDGRIALLHTPNNNINFRSRNPLSVWISNDDMRSWYYKKEVCDFDGCYSYPDGFITQDQKHIMFTVDFNRHDIYFFDHEIKD
jgi:predicted neuraminidase